MEGQKKAMKNSAHETFMTLHQMVLAFIMLVTGS